MSSAFKRVIVLVDMDCFYVQVEQRRDPSLKGKPCAVVQYKKWKGGGIIAVGYEARAVGVTRGMMGDDAKEKCPEINLCRVPESNGKANLDRYREAGAEVINVLSQFGGRVERASIDEAYIDLTEVVAKVIDQNTHHGYLDPDKLPNTHVVEWPAKLEEEEDKSKARLEGLKNWLSRIETDMKYMSDLRLTIAARITEEIRAAVFHQTGFRCSAGISHNKLLSKLACGINKPNKQTVLPCDSIPALFETIKIKKIRNLGGKLGKSLVENFGVNFIGEVGKIPLEQLVTAYGHKSAHWLHEVCRGIDHEPVKERHIAQSIGCGKNFLGKEALNTKAKVAKWMDALTNELSERLDRDKAANNRIAKTLTVGVRLETGQSLSRSGPLLKYGKEDILQQCLQLIRSLDSKSSQDAAWYPAIISMSINAKKFDEYRSSSTGSILNHTSPSKSKQEVLEEDVQSSSYQKHSTPKGKQENLVSKYFCKKVEEDALAEKEENTRTSGSSDVNVKCNSIQTSKQHLNHNSETKDSHSYLSNRKSSGYVREKHENLMSKYFSKKAEEVDLCSSSPTSKQNPTNVEHGASSSGPTQVENDVVYVSSQTSTKPGKSFFDLTANTNSKSQSAKCMIDQAFEKERSKQQRSSLSDLKGSVTHPLYGEIDLEVFENLPPEIKNEISKSYEISESVIPSSQPIRKQPNQNSKAADKQQRTIHNFIPNTQNTSVPQENRTPLSRTKTKRQNSDTNFPSNKKAKRSGLTKKSPVGNSKNKKPMCKIDLFSSQNRDVVPLGFFRQRSQLSNAISKALTKQQPSSKFNNL